MDTSTSIAVVVAAYPISLVAPQGALFSRIFGTTTEDRELGLRHQWKHIFTLI